MVAKGAVLAMAVMALLVFATQTYAAEKTHEGTVVISQTKTWKPLDPDQANRLFWQPLRGTDWCLNGKRNLFRVGFHTYRHSFASNLAAAGVDQRLIDEFMGHQTEEMRKRYRHLFPKQRRSAIESFSLAAQTLNPS